MKIIIRLIGILTILVLIVLVAFQMMRTSWLLEHKTHPSSKLVKEYLNADEIIEIGPVETNYLRTPKSFGYFVVKDSYKYVAVFEKDFGKKDESNEYLKILPSELLNKSDQKETERIQTIFNIHNDVKILSKHKVILVKDNQEINFPYPFYKVTFTDLNEYYLTFYCDKNNIINAHSTGYENLLSY